MTDVRGLGRRFALLNALRWAPAGLAMPVLVLLLQARGVGLATVGVLVTLFSGVVIALELPTGGLADALGRRGVLAASGVLAVASSLLLATMHAVPWLALGFVVMGVARALSSGPLEAWYVDTVLARDPHADLTSGLSRGHTAEALGLGAGALAGGALPALVTALPASGDAVLLRMSVPHLAAAGLAALFVVAVVLLVTDEAHARRRATVRGTLADVPHTVRAAVRLGRDDRVLRRLLGRVLLVGAAIAAVEILVPAQLAELLDSQDAAAATYGVLVTAGFFAVGGGTAVAPVLARLLRSVRRATVATTLAVAVSIGALASPTLAPVVLAFVAFYAVLGAGGVLVAEMMHRRVSPAERSTVLSLDSLVQQAGGSAATLTLPALATATSFGLAWAVMAGLTALGASLLVRMPVDVVPDEVGTCDETPATRA